MVWIPSVEKKGILMNLPPRPRSYRMPLPAGFASETVASLAAALTETTERHFDLVRRLPPALLESRLGEAPSTPFEITAHLGWGDGQWFGFLRGRPIPLAPILEGEKGVSGNLDEVIAACQAVRDEGMAFLRGVVDPRQALSWRQDGKASVLGVMSHLIWHWTYHCGQCGEIALAQGHSHPWTFDRDLGHFE
jgi:uncharacterized damage-inducible protein DinB